MTPSLLLVTLESIFAEMRRYQMRSDLLDRLLDLMTEHPQATGADYLDVLGEWEADDE